MSGDIYDMFTRPDDLCSCVQASDPHCIAPGTHCSVLNIINRVSTFVDRGQPGGWNDLDMLEVGNGGMTDEEVCIILYLCYVSPLVGWIGEDLSFSVRFVCLTGPMRGQNLIFSSTKHISHSGLQSNHPF